MAHTDVQFRDLVFGRLMNRFNQEKWAELDVFGEVAPVVGFDFYEYKKESFDYFDEMLSNQNERVLKTLFNIKLVSENNMNKVLKAIKTYGKQ